MHSSWLSSFLVQPPGQQASGGMMIIVIQIGALLAIFWFLLIRPQRMQAKQHEQMLKALKRGDEIVTSGGIVGKVVHLKDDRVTIESGESRLVIERERVAKVITAPAAEPAQK